MTIERNGHIYATGEDLGFERQYDPTIFATINAQTDAAYPIPEGYESAGMSQYLWMVGQSLNPAANTLGMDATPQQIAAKAIAITNAVFVQLAKENRQ